MNTERSRKDKQDQNKFVFPEVNIEEEIKQSNNVHTDEFGTKYSCHYLVSKNEAGSILYNGFPKAEILNPRMKGLNLYVRVSKPRFKLDQKDNERKGITRDAFDAFLELVKCPICLEVMQDPMNVKTCLHKFCGKCIERYIRVEKKECPTCRTSIGSRRLLRKDNKLKQIIDRLIPNLEDYQIFEQEDVQRNIKAISKSESHRQKMREMQKIKERQFRAEIEERKDLKTPRQARSLGVRRPEPRTRPQPRQREPLNDKRYRTIKKQKTSEVSKEPYRDYPAASNRPINIKFKLKQISSRSQNPCYPKSSERILEMMMISTNDEITLQTITKYIQMKNSSRDFSNIIISYFVRNKDDNTLFDKLASNAITLFEVRKIYWKGERIQSLYFMLEFA
jgi:hypothetical protein